MVQDFPKPYSGIVYFSGLWSDGTADALGGRDALNVLAEAVRQCGDDDQRQRAEVQDALSYLDKQSGCTSRLNAFRRAFDIVPPRERQAAAHAAMTALAASMMGR